MASGGNVGNHLRRNVRSSMCPSASRVRLSPADAASPSRLAWTPSALPKVRTASCRRFCRAASATAPDADAESLSRAPLKPRVAPSAPTPAPAFAANPPRNTPATRSCHRPRAAPHPELRSSADDPPNKIRPHREDVMRIKPTPVKLPQRQRPARATVAVGKTDESSRSDDARWLNSTPAKVPAHPCSTTSSKSNIRPDTSSGGGGINCPTRTRIVR